MSTYLDARCDDRTGRTIEVGVFKSDTDECVQVFPITRKNALELLTAIESALTRQEEAYKPRQEPLL